MFKIAFLVVCVCASIWYYSGYKQKVRIDTEISMEILRGLEEDNFPATMVNDLLEASGESERVKNIVRGNLAKGLSYSKYKRIDYGEYELQD